MLSLFSSWEEFSSGFEEIFSSSRHLPHYKYLARPIYKFAASYTHPIAAVAITFVAMDALIHQIAPKLVICALENIEEYPTPCHVSWVPQYSLIWGAFAIPVMYAKYKKNLNI